MGPNLRDAPAYDGPVTTGATGIGGIFFRARDPDALATWYRNHLGISTFAGDAGEPWWQAAGPTVFSTFPADTDYFGRPQQAFMLNFRVPDLDAMVTQLRDAGVPIEDVQAFEGLGRFSWATDPEGNRFELWEPAPEATREPPSA
jgi:glyoxylase I family protein